MLREIGDIVRELQEAFQQRYGLIAEVNIDIHESWNENKTSFDMAAKLLDDIIMGLPGEIEHRSVKNEYGLVSWHKLEAKKASVIVFYPMPEDGEVQDE